jgi:hypothetical protein
MNVLDGLLNRYVPRRERDRTWDSDDKILNKVIPRENVKNFEFSREESVSRSFERAERQTEHSSSAVSFKYKSLEQRDRPSSQHSEQDLIPENISSFWASLEEGKRDSSLVF